MKDASEWADREVNIEIEDGMATIEWLVAIDTENPFYVDMEVREDQFEDEEELREAAWKAYHVSGDVGVSPVDAMKRDLL